MKRPAEITTGAGAVALLLALVLGLDTETVAIVGVVLGFVPAAVTLLVNHGGVRGVIVKLWTGAFRA